MTAKEKFEALAAAMYFNIWVSPEGFPNGLPTWAELPEDPTPVLGYQTCKSFWREQAIETTMTIIAIEKKASDSMLIHASDELDKRAIQ